LLRVVVELISNTGEVSGEGWRLFLSVVGTKGSLDPGERLRSVTAGSEL
jgi:hypothetical protein